MGQKHTKICKFASLICMLVYKRILLFTDKMCLFGQRLIRVGQKFEKTVQMPRNMTVTCECKIPPLLTCVTYVV